MTGERQRWVPVPFPNGKSNPLTAPGSLMTGPQITIPAEEAAVAADGLLTSADGAVLAASTTTQLQLDGSVQVVDADGDIVGELAAAEVPWFLVGDGTQAAASKAVVAPAISPAGTGPARFQSPAGTTYEYWQLGQPTPIPTAEIFAHLAAMAEEDDAAIGSARPTER